MNNNMTRVRDAGAREATESALKAHSCDDEVVEDARDPFIQIIA